MKKLLTNCMIIVGAFMITLGLSGCSIRSEKVNITQDFAAESIKEVKIEVKDTQVELVIQASEDQEAHVQLSGIKAKADKTYLDASIKESALVIEADWIEKSIIDLDLASIKNETSISLLVQLPEKLYESIEIQVKDNTSKIQVQNDDGKMEQIAIGMLPLDFKSLFGPIQIK